MASQITHDDRVVRRLGRYYRLSAALVAGLGTLVLIGWLLDIDALMRVAPGLVTMKANTALCFLLSGLALSLTHAETALLRYLRTLCIGLIICIAGLTLAEIVFDKNLGIDQLLFQDNETPIQTSPPGRMSPATAICFLLTGLALWLHAITSKTSAHLAQWLSVSISLFGLTALYGYLFNVAILYKIGLYSSMALHTAIGFILIGTGLLAARAQHGWVALLVTDGPGGALLRQLLPAAIAIPSLVVWLIVYGQRAGLYEADFRPVLFVMALITLLTLVIWRGAVRLNKKHQHLLESNNLFRGLFESAPSAIFILDNAGKLLQANSAAEQLFKQTRQNLQGRAIRDLIPGLDPTQHTAEASLQGARDDGSSFPVNVNIGVLSLGNDIVYLAIIRDMSKLQAAENEIRSLNAGLELRVSERTAELAAINKELESFAHSVSHDLRAPLRHIDGYIDILQTHAEGTLDAISLGYIDKIASTASRMGTLIDALLTFSRMGRTALHRNWVDLGALMQECLKELAPDCQDRDIQWTIGELPHVYADGTMLRQVLLNLLGNAIKFTRHRDKAEIEVGFLRGDNTENALFVRDNGAGFDEHYADKLFGVFQRLHRADEFEGTGIGLANVQRIISRHGGRVWAQGETGVGATFYFTLPGTMIQAARHG